MADFSVTFSNNDSSFNSTMGEGVNVTVVSGDHNDLRNRNAANAHPISSITGLEDEIEKLKQHLEDEVRHINEEERASWNAKSRVFRDAEGALVISH